MRMIINQCACLSHVVNKQLAFDVTVLCDLIDHICCCLIFATRGRSTLPSRVEVTLPKSWILRAMPHIHRLPSMDVQLSYLYKQNLATMLDRIFRAGTDSGISCIEWHVVAGF